MTAFEPAPGFHANLPYCGEPPDPATLLWRWNLDPLLLALLIAAVVAYAGLSRREPLPPVVPTWRRLCFYGGWALATAAVVSPLCALSVSLFSARVGQHMILEMIAAPLAALGLPVLVSDGARPGGRWWRMPATAWSHGALAAAVAFAAALWFWHAPGPYTATFESGFAYWLMHVTLLGTALWLWTALFGAAPRRLGDFLAAALLTTLQMGLLGAVITFAARPLYRVHGFTTQGWGLTPLEDQQLGGVIMWVPAGTIFLAAIMIAMAAAMRRSGRGSLLPARP